MIGGNELLFLLHVAVAAAVVVAAGRRGRTWLAAVVVVCTVLMNIVVAKQMTLLTLNVTGGNVLFATVFLASDVINEHYGRRAARNTVLLGFAAGLFVLVMTQFVVAYAPNEYDDAQGHLLYFFGAQGYPRIVAASMASFLLSQLLDVSIYNVIRTRTGTQRLLWLRSNLSTWIAQAFDTVFFTTAALTGPASIIRSWPEWRDAVLFAFLIKVLVAALDTPFLYLTKLPALRPPGSGSAED